MREFTPEQREQSRRLKRALRKAVEKLQGMSEEEMSKKGLTGKECQRTASVLIQAIVRLDSTAQNRDDLPLGVFRIYLNKNRYPKVKEILSKGLQVETLHTFGSLSWEAVQEAFEAAGIECPLEFSSFHSAYQEELKLSTSGSPD